MGEDQDTAEVAVRLSVALKRLRSRLREESGTTSTGFTISQLALLHRLIEAGPATAASLAAAEHVSQQAIAQSVATLKAGDLVRTRRDPGDGRKVLISPTESGLALYSSLLASREAWLVRAIDAVVAPGERAALGTAIELLERLAAAELGAGVEIR